MRKLREHQIAVTVLTAFAVVAGIEPHAEATTYNYSTIDYTDPGCVSPSCGIQTDANGINNAGEIVGQYSESSPYVSAGFLDISGSITKFSEPSYYLSGINNSGQIVGDSGTEGVVYSSGATTIIVAGGLSTEANAINDKGDVVGSEILTYTNGVPTYKGFLDVGGIIGQVAVSGAKSTTVNGINNSGQFVGSYDGHGYVESGTWSLSSGGVFTPGTVTTIDFPGATSTAATGINDMGQIVGTYLDSSGKTHGFLDSMGTFITIDDPSATGYTLVSGINDSGKIVGSYYAGGDHGFIATPNAGGMGDPHLTSFDGRNFDFQAIGDYLLTRSTVPGDSFDVQIRTEAGKDAAAVAVISEIAAKLGSDRVTFDLLRAQSGGSFVWVDGRPALLSGDNPVLQLAGGRIVEVSPTEFQVIWDTGEVMVVTNAGAFLNVTFPNSGDFTPGSYTGLLGAGAGWTTDFSLSNGTSLSPAISTDVIDGIFADSWMVSGTDSVLDPAAAIDEPAGVCALGIGAGLIALARIRRRGFARAAGGPPGRAWNVLVSANMRLPSV